MGRIMFTPGWKEQKRWEGGELALSRYQHFIPLKKSENQWPVLSMSSATGACVPDMSCPFWHLKCFIIFFKESIPHNSELELSWPKYTLAVVWQPCCYPWIQAPWFQPLQAWMPPEARTTGRTAQRGQLGSPACLGSDLGCRSFAMPHKVLYFLCLWALAYSCDRSAHFALGCPDALMGVCLFVSLSGPRMAHDKHS